MPGRAGSEMFCSPASVSSVPFGSTPGLTGFFSLARLRFRYLCRMLTVQFQMKTPALILAFAVAGLFSLRAPAALSRTDSPKPDDFILAGGGIAAAIMVEPNESRAVSRAAGDLE